MEHTDNDHKLGENISTVKRNTKIQVTVFWIVTPCSNVAGYQCFRASCCLHLEPEDRGSMVIWNIGILPHHYTVSQPTRSQLESSLL